MTRGSYSPCACVPHTFVESGRDLVRDIHGRDDQCTAEQDQRADPGRHCAVEHPIPRVARHDVRAPFPKAERNRLSITAVPCFDLPVIFSLYESVH